MVIKLFVGLLNTILLLLFYIFYMHHMYNVLCCILYTLCICTRGASLVSQLVKNPPSMREILVWSLGWEDPLEKGKATHSSILDWRIPWTVQSVRGVTELDMTERLLLPFKYTCILLEKYIYYQVRVSTMYCITLCLSTLEMFHKCQLLILFWLYARHSSGYLELWD